MSYFKLFFWFLYTLLSAETVYGPLGEGVFNVRSHVKALFWILTPCNVLSFFCCFEGTYFFHVQGD